MEQNIHNFQGVLSREWSECGRGWREGSILNEWMRMKIGKGLKKIGKETLLRIYKTVESKKIYIKSTDW